MLIFLDNKESHAWRLPGKSYCKKQGNANFLYVSRREVERTIDANRIECLLLNFDSSPDINLGEVLTATLPRLFSGILFSLSTSGNQKPS